MSPKILHCSICFCCCSKLETRGFCCSRFSLTPNFRELQGPPVVASLGEKEANDKAYLFKSVLNPSLIAGNENEEILNNPLFSIIPLELNFGVIFQTLKSWGIKFY